MVTVKPQNCRLHNLLDSANAGILNPSCGISRSTYVLRKFSLQSTLPWSDEARKLSGYPPRSQNLFNSKFVFCSTSSIVNGVSSISPTLPANDSDVFCIRSCEADPSKINRPG